MSEKATQSRPTIACPTPLVLFGIDSRGKPKAARFGKQHAGLALKAATQLQLQVLASKDPKIADLAARLPVGRVHATGRTFVPFIRRDLYVAAAAETGPPTLTPVEWVVKRVWINARWLGASLAERLAGDRARRSGYRKRQPRGGLVRGNRRLRRRRHAHITVARLPARAADCPAPGSDCPAVPERQTDASGCAAIKIDHKTTRQRCSGQPREQRARFAKQLATDRHRPSRVGQRRWAMAVVVGGGPGRKGRRHAQAALE